MDFDKIFIRLSAPTLCGIKPANLFSMKSCVTQASWEKIKCLNAQLSQFGKRVISIKRCTTEKNKDAHTLFFVYDQNMLGQVVTGDDAKKYLDGKKYPVERGQGAVLGELFRRLAHDVDFPHEIGIFLGYPLGDVISFSEKKPRVTSGFWAVYSDELEAVKTMELYKKCSAYCIWLSALGIDIPSISKIGGNLYKGISKNFNFERYL